MARTSFVSQLAKHSADARERIVRFFQSRPYVGIDRAQFGSLPLDIRSQRHELSTHFRAQRRQFLRLGHKYFGYVDQCVMDGAVEVNLLPGEPTGQPLARIFYPQLEPSQRATTITEDWRQPVPGAASHN